MGLDKASPARRKSANLSGLQSEKVLDPLSRLGWTHVGRARPPGRSPRADVRRRRPALPPLRRTLASHRNDHRSARRARILRHIGARYEPLSSRSRGRRSNGSCLSPDGEALRLSPRFSRLPRRVSAGRRLTSPCTCVIPALGDPEQTAPTSPRAAAPLYLATSQSSPSQTPNSRAGVPLFGVRTG